MTRGQGIRVPSSYRSVDGGHVRQCPLCEREIWSPVAFFLTSEFIEYCQRMGVHSSACMECIREFASLNHEDVRCGGIK